VPIRDNPITTDSVLPGDKRGKRGDDRAPQLSFRLERRSRGILRMKHFAVLGREARSCSWISGGFPRGSAEAEVML
jgi:hypothetical protein